MKYDVETIQKIMVDYGVVIRAIPMVERFVLEVCHKDQYPEGKVVMMGKPFNREMLVFEKPLHHAGKFIVAFANNTMSTVRFDGKHYFDTIDDVIDYVIETQKKD